MDKRTALRRRAVSSQNLESLSYCTLRFASSPSDWNLTTLNSVIIHVDINNNESTEIEPFRFSNYAFAF